VRNLLFKLVGLAILASSLFFGWQLMRYQSFVKFPLEVGDEGVTVLVRPGMSLAAVAQELAQRGLLQDDRLFVWMGRLSGKAADLKAGEYRIEPGTTPQRLLEQLVAGQVVQYNLTLVEGWNFRQVMEAVNASPQLEHTLASTEPAEVMARIGRAGEHPEGRFFPDTYHFPRGMSDIEFLRRAYRAMAERLEREWAGRADGLPLETPYEALILASVVEKETGQAWERPAIAGVFIRRLKKGMLLQTDPTVIYGLGNDFDGNLTRTHLQSDNPYNTYRRRGLPPTPIAMPGGESLHAALHPEEGDALYFVAKGDGSHYFSATLEEHNRAVVKYQLRGRRQGP